MDSVHGLGVWIQVLGSIITFHVCTPHMHSPYAISIWIRDMHLVHGLHTTIAYMDSTPGFLMCMQH